MKERLAEMMRNMVRLTFGGAAELSVGASRFGGAPDVPADFIWPRFRTDTFEDDRVKERPLSFLAQFNCREMSAWDTEGLLPKTGLLAFFYECGSQRWGFDPTDKGCARVFWFEDLESLQLAAFPVDLPEEYRFPALGVRGSAERSWPGLEDFFFGGAWPPNAWEVYAAARTALGDPVPEFEENTSKLLGWPDLIQGNITQECELVTRGYRQGSPEDYEKVPAQLREQARRTSLEDWRLLFQLDTVSGGGFELMFGDCGRIYFFIRKEDLQARRFDRVWLTLQCG